LAKKAAVPAGREEGFEHIRPAGTDKNLLANVAERVRGAMKNLPEEQSTRFNFGANAIEKSSLANELADKLGAKVVGSAAKAGTTPRDLDLRLEGEHDSANIEAKMNNLGYESRGSS